jgi:2-polyprenyl-3-methyl-5-hydroxy-6-metoxy-1,4-benzoquinol methylase
MLKSFEVGNTLYQEFHRSTSTQNKIISRNNFTYRLILDVAEKYLTKDKKVLDIGCGSGTLCYYFANKGNKTLGIDTSENAIKVCKESTRKLGLTKRCDFVVMKFPNQIPEGKFDFVIFTEVIEHLKDDDKALAVINGSLNTDGLMLLSTPSSNAPLHRLGLTKHFDKRVGHLRRYKLEELEALCLKNGFKIVYRKKVEGILRNFLFIDSKAGKLVRFVKLSISDLVTFLDNLLIPIFGESNLIVIAQKIN